MTYKTRVSRLLSLVTFQQDLTKMYFIPKLKSITLPGKLKQDRGRIHTHAHRTNSKEQQLF